jgi:hypothetical protein
LTSPLDDLLNFAHQSYVRMEAEQLISECLELGDPSPFNDMVEGLVLAGTSSLILLREILEEVLNVKSMLSQEGLGIRQDLVDALGEFGVHVPQLLYVDAPDDFRQISNKHLKYGLGDLSANLRSEDELLLEEICLEAGERVKQIGNRLTMISHFEESVRDWMRCLAYEAMQRRDDHGSPSSGKYIQ